MPLTGASAGTRREVTLYRYGAAGAQPKVYLQAGLHADEMPGVLVLQHLMTLLDEAEVAGEILGEIFVVPIANPIGLSQWLHQRPFGRQDVLGLRNFNRGFPELGKLVADRLEPLLTPDPEQNLHVIRRAFRAALAELTPCDDLQEMMVGLMSWSCDADHVLDLHCDQVGMMHLYASTAQPQITRALCQAIGARVALIADDSGGCSFDEAQTLPWRQLRARYGERVPAGSFSATLEYRGQFDVSDALALPDARNLMGFLARVGAVKGDARPRFADARHLPLAGAAQVFAPQGGVVTWLATPGDEVAEGQVLGHVTDPVSRRRLPVTSPIAGVLFRLVSWRACLRGQFIAHVAGEKVLRDGPLQGP